MTMDPDKEEEALAWGPSSTRKSLGANEIHLWRIRHAAGTRELAQYHRILSVNEQNQAARFRAPRSRDEFIQTRACLRLLVARYSGTSLASLHFTVGPFGKPALSDLPLSFNVSHTEGVSMIAITAQAAVGVDVECVRAAPDLLAIAATHFSRNELSKLRSLEEAELTGSFFRCWTRKEAFLKAQGLGLPHGLDAFEVTLLPHETPAVLACTWLAGAPDRWTITHFEPLPGICGALAFESPVSEPTRPMRPPDPHVVSRDWSLDLAGQLLG